jgi:hypothetical protein
MRMMSSTGICSVLIGRFSQESASKIACRACSTGLKPAAAKLTYNDATHFGLYSLCQLRTPRDAVPGGGKREQAELAAPLITSHRNARDQGPRRPLCQPI